MMPAQLTDRQSELLDLFTVAAEHGRPCPTNTTIVKQTSLVSMNMAQRTIAQLIDVGLIELSRSGRDRVVKIAATGKLTTVEIRVPAAPTPIEKRRRRKKTDDAQHLNTSDSKHEKRLQVRQKLFNEGSPLSGLGPQIYPPAVDCQWPLGNGPPFGFCRVATVTGSSYCAEHELVSRSPTRQRVGR